MREKSLWYLLFGLLIVYMLANTGAAVDDFKYIPQASGKTLAEALIPHGGWLTTPVEIYTHYVWYHFCRVDELAVINFIKTFYILLCFYLASKFFGIYLGFREALFASFLFIFFPSHDSTVYWFLGQYLTLSFGLYLYAFYLAHNKRFVAAFIAAILASFVSYGSPAIALGLFILFILQGEIRKGFVILTPNLIYFAYFLFLTRVANLGVSRIVDGMSFSMIAKQYLFQILTFIDATLGPSMWLKIYYSFQFLTVSSITIGALLVALLYKCVGEKAAHYNKKIIIAFTILTLASFLLFVLTGRYPQLAFNVGNRTTIFGSLLLAYLITLIPLHKNVRIAIFALLIFGTLGISDHWKAWEVHKQDLMHNIKNNQALRGYDDTRPIYVSGNQYSKYGRISHIEFFGEEGVGPLFEALLNKKILAMPINRNFRYEDGYLEDLKFGERYKVDEYINVYDSVKNNLLKLNSKDINAYIDKLPRDNRHWTQAFDIGYIKEMAVRLMPRLKYAL